MDDHEFKRLNGRRIALIDKMHSGFTEEENARRFDEHPGWKAECERRYRANLTDAEREELATLERLVGDEVNRRFPLPKIPMVN